jgi:uncharacterized Tic20 family protein
MSSDPSLPVIGTVGTEERHWAMAAHLCGLLWLLGGGIVLFPPFGAIGLLTVVGPLVIWKTKGQTMPFVAEQAKEALNFQITILLMAALGLLLTLLLIGFLLLWILGVLNLLFVLIAAIKVSEGKPYRYPFCIRLVS